jgi:hypothetical protein
MQISDAKADNAEKSEWEGLAEITEGQDKAQTSEEYFSVCDIWKENVHRLITKIEYQAPIYIQAFSQVNTEFLHCVDNLFGTCYIWQKQYFDRLGIDQKVVNAYGKSCEAGVNSTIEFMDLYANYKKFQADTFVEYMKIGNNYLHWWIDIFGRSVSLWNFKPNC